MEVKTQLLKHFSSVLRTRVLGNMEVPNISTNTLRFLSRKELINIVKKRFDGTIPKQYNLVEMENKELLELIGDEMYIIAHFTSNWCNESLEPVKKDKEESAPIQTSKTDSKKKEEPIVKKSIPQKQQLISKNTKNAKTTQ